MKNIKNATNKKRVKSEFVPAYTVDLTNVTGENDARTQFALCKYKNNIDDLNAGDIQTLKEYIKSLALTFAFNELMKIKNLFILSDGTIIKEPAVLIGHIKEKVAQKKLNIFKRFWNWLTRKK